MEDNSESLKATGMPTKEVFKELNTLYFKGTFKPGMGIEQLRNSLRKGLGLSDVYVGNMTMLEKPQDVTNFFLSLNAIKVMRRYLDHTCQDHMPFHEILGLFESLRSVLRENKITPEGVLAFASHEHMSICRQVAITANFSDEVLLKVYRLFRNRKNEKEIPELLGELCNNYNLTYQNAKVLVGEILKEKDDLRVEITRFTSRQDHFINRHVEQAWIASEKNDTIRKSI
jgi:hypothetical protein